MVWPDAHVQPENLKTLVHELRTSIGDSAREPRYIETYAGRGYSFVASVSDAPAPFGRSGSSGSDSWFVGREQPLSLLDDALNRATVSGQAQVVLVEGERGAGKSALCEAFVRQTTSRMSVRTSRGQCLESTGPLESYGVLVDAIDTLAAQYPWLVPAAIAQRAPSWRDHCPQWWPSDGPRPAAVKRKEAASQRSERELIAVLEELSTDLPLLLVLEDMQWGDLATIECLRGLARRSTVSSLCIVATYCRAQAPEMSDALERLGRDLKLERRGTVVRLDALGDDQVHDYVTHHLGARAAAIIAPALCDATSGHPLFMATATERLMALLDESEGAEWDDGLWTTALASALADGLQTQIDRLTSDERIVLEAAAIIGPVFSPAAVMVGLGVEHVQPIASRLQSLASRRVLIEACEAAGPPNPGLERYRFRHETTVELLVAPIPIFRYTMVSARVARSRIPEVRRA